MSEELSHAAYMRHQNPVVCQDLQLQTSTAGALLHADLDSRQFTLAGSETQAPVSCAEDKLSLEESTSKSVEFDRNEELGSGREVESSAESDQESDQESDGDREALASD